MSKSEFRTLKEFVDSEQDLRGVGFRSKIQITGGGAFVYEVSQRPNGSNNFRAIPRDVPLTGTEGYSDVGVPYWQHRDDERCDFEQSSQLAS